MVVNLPWFRFHSSTSASKTNQPLTLCFCRSMIGTLSDVRPSGGSDLRPLDPLSPRELKSYLLPSDKVVWGGCLPKNDSNTVYLLRKYHMLGAVGFINGIELEACKKTSHKKTTAIFTPTESQTSKNSPSAQLRPLPCGSCHLPREAPGTTGITGAQHRQQKAHCSCERGQVRAVLTAFSQIS